MRAQGLWCPQENQGSSLQGERVSGSQEQGEHRKNGRDQLGSGDWKKSAEGWGVPAKGERINETVITQRSKKSSKHWETEKGKWLDFHLKVSSSWRVAFLDGPDSLVSGSGRGMFGESWLSNGVNWVWRLRGIYYVSRAVGSLWLFSKHSLEGMFIALSHRGRDTGEEGHFKC